MTVAAQIIGVIAMALSILSFQFKTGRSIMLMQMVGSVFFAVNMFMLGAVTGAILNLFGALRAMIFIFHYKLKIPKAYLILSLFSVYIISYVLTFTAFGTEPSAKNLLIEFFPLIGAAAITVGFAFGDPRTIRFMGFVCSPAWLIYNTVYLSIGGILCEIFAIISLVSAFIRYDLKKIKECFGKNKKG